MFFSALAEGRKGVAMRDRIFRTGHLAGALAAGLLVASCGTEATGPRLAASWAAVGSADPISFNLISPNTARNPTTGDIIRTTGSGSFDATARTILASGSFTHFRANGSVVARGTWAATAFTSFWRFGGPNPGTQGGVLVFAATLFPVGGSPVPGLPVTVTCLVKKPSGFTGEEGTTVGAFTDKTDGMTLFHLN
jgi:hypothetical protein